MDQTTPKSHPRRLPDRVVKEDINKNTAKRSEWSVRLKEFRRAENLTLDEMAQKLGIALASLNKYENGGTFVPIEIAVKLNKLFGMNYEWFFNGQGRRKTTGGEKQNIITDLASLNQVLLANTQKTAALEREIFKLVNRNRDQQNQINQLKIQLNNK